jgi:hypothetical protein
MRNSRFHDVAERLLNAGVSPRRVRRLISELADHFDDLREELKARGLTSEEADAEATSRLATGALVEGVLARPELRSWVRRWPWAAFTVLPVAMYASLFATELAVLVFSVEFAKNELGMDFSSSAWLVLTVRTLLGGAEWALPIVAAGACCAIALLRRAPAIWATTGVVLISLLGALTNAQLDLPPAVPRAALGAGIGFNTESLLLPISRAAVTLTVVLVAYFWIRHTQNRAESSHG